MSKKKQILLLPTDEVLAEEAARPGYIAAEQLLTLERIADALDRLADLAERAAEEGGVV